MTPTVFVVDDDADLREALVQLLEAAGLQVASYPDGAAFLAACEQDRPGCLLLDVAMPGMTGLEVQAELTRRGNPLPIVFLTGHGDIPMAVRAVQAGAVDFLEKPVTGGTLLERVHRALALDQDARDARAMSREIAERARRLSQREREVMALVVGGSSSKEVARLLGISVRTVEAHRTHVMHKMGATNLAELVAMAAHSDLVSVSAAAASP
jgi:two-component system response regulator FixJ